MFKLAKISQRYAIAIQIQYRKKEKGRKNCSLFEYLGKFIINDCIFRSFFLFYASYPLGFTCFPFVCVVIRNFFLLLVSVSFVESDRLIFTFEFILLEIGLPLEILFTSGPYSAKEFFLWIWNQLNYFWELHY